jgi:cytochrome c oxidase subunit IV
MSHAPTEAHGGRTHKPHVLPIRVYLGVWIGLLVLTFITVKTSYYNFGIMNLIVAMGVATLKASLVVLFFMHLKYDEKFNAVIFVASLTFLSIFFVLTLADTMERGKVDPLEAHVLVPVPARPELDRREPAPGAPAGTAPAKAESLAAPAPAESTALPPAHAPGEGAKPPGGH